MKSKKIMILGMSPMPFENDIKVYGTGIRTWQFAMPLLQSGHSLCIVGYAIPSAYPEGFKSRCQRSFNAGKYNFEYHILEKTDFESTGALTDIADDFDPDCLVGCTFYPSYMAVKTRKALKEKNNKAIPLWADLFGHVMAEAQARAFMDGDDAPLFHYWNSESNIVAEADIFSCVSKRQAYATIGELGALGRLNRHTCGYDFARTIPCGMPSEDFRHERQAIRGKQGITDSNFVILWSGGYNTWTDVDTLYKGLIMAMEKDDSIRFVSTGGEIPEQDINTYPRFLSLINSGKFSDHFVMKGWIPGAEVPDHYFEADIGINIDKDIYEVKLGSKNRILDWFRAGLCVLSSDVCELTEEMSAAGAGFIFRPGDPQGLADMILMLSSHPGKVSKAAAAGRTWGMEEFSFEKTTAPLQEWVKDPRLAPDYGRERKLFSQMQSAVKSLEEISEGQKKMIAERDLQIRELQAIVKGRLPYRTYNYLKKLRRKIKR
jgi:glycosyltransferase involved in cell wall biosynthesis